MSDNAIVKMGEETEAHESFLKAYRVVKELGDKANQKAIIEEMQKIEDLEKFAGEKVCEGLRIELTEKTITSIRIVEKGSKKKVRVKSQPQLLASTPSVAV